MHFTKSAALRPPRVRAHPPWAVRDCFRSRSRRAAARPSAPRNTVPAELQFFSSASRIGRKAEVFRRKTIDELTSCAKRGRKDDRAGFRMETCAGFDFGKQLQLHSNFDANLLRQPRRGSHKETSRVGRVFGLREQVCGNPAGIATFVRAQSLRLGLPGDRSRNRRSRDVSRRSRSDCRDQKFFRRAARLPCHRPVLRWPARRRCRATLVMPRNAAAASSF